MEGAEGEQLDGKEGEYLDPKEEILQGTLEECTMRGSVCAL